ncbi:MAG: tetratricopeptide repeat protein [Acidobacteriota bacterium]
MGASEAAYRPGPVAIALALFAGLFAPGVGRALQAAEPPSAPLLESAAIAIATESDPEASARKIRRALSRLEKKAKRRIRGAENTQERRGLFDRFFFTEAGFRGSTALDTRRPEDGRSESGAGLLLHEVLETRSGTCVGLAQIYLILSDRLELPVVGAATPAHLFVRWLNGGARINTELLEQGAEHPDADYRTRYRIDEADPSDPVFLRDLTTDEVAARIYNNRGVLRSHAGHLEAASADYARAIDLDVKFPAPYYNRGLDQLNSGQLKEALSSLDAALTLHPGDAWALNNRGLVHLKLGRLEQAEEDFRLAVAIEPGLAAARKNLSLVSSRIDRGDRVGGDKTATEGTASSSGTTPARDPAGETAGPRP